MAKAARPQFQITIPPEDLVWGRCPECGLETDLWAGFCLLATNCRSDYQSRVARHVGRAIDAGTAHTWFDPRDVFVASRWRCYLCGVETPSALYGENHPQAPQLDHVVPMSRGGAHTPENVECICRRCNVRKGSRLLHELGMAPVRLAADVVAGIPRSDAAPWDRGDAEPIPEGPIGAAAEEGRRAAEETLRAWREAQGAVPPTAPKSPGSAHRLQPRKGRTRMPTCRA